MKNQKKYLVVLFALIFTVMLRPFVAYAAVSERLELNHSYYIYSWEEYELSTNLENSGRLTLEMSGNCTCYVRDAKLVEVSNITLKDNESKTWTLDVVAGTYTIIFSAHDTMCTLKVKFSKADETTMVESFEEKNNLEEFANKISTGKTIKGQLAHNDDIDLYKLTLKKNGTLKVTIDSKIANKGIKVGVFQKGGKKAKYSKALKKGKSTVSFKNLKKGTWYLAIQAQNTANDTYTGQYSFSASF